MERVPVLQAAGLALQQVVVQPQGLQFAAQPGQVRTERAKGDPVLNLVPAVLLLVEEQGVHGLLGCPFMGQRLFALRSVRCLDSLNVKNQRISDFTERYFRLSHGHPLHLIHTPY
ncbi:hypothetical protein D3C86_1631260 [compost metagenome]